MHSYVFFAMLEVMKKIILVIFYLLLIGQFTPVSYVSAIGNDALPCKCDDQNMEGKRYNCDGISGDETCKDNLFCSQTGTNSIDCVDRDEAKKNTQITCSCKNPGTPGSGNNGMTCTKGNITYDDINCNPEEFACYNGDQNYMTIGANSGINSRNDDLYDDNFKDQLAKGVNCKSPLQQKAEEKIACKCKNPATPGTTDTDFNGKNGFTCGSQSDKFEMTCDDDDKGCYDDPKGTVNLVSGSGMRVHEKQSGGNDEFDNNLKGKTGTGVRCESKTDQQKQLAETPWPSQPPPVPPPCKGSMDASGQCDSFNTAFGVMNTDAPRLTTSLFAILLSFSGGLALLLIIRSGYTLITSQGNPQKVQEGRDQLVAAIVGLVFLVFSFVLLQLIGYDILRIPGWGDGGNGTVNSRVNGG